MFLNVTFKALEILFFTPDSVAYLKRLQPFLPVTTHLLPRQRPHVFNMSVHYIITVQHAVGERELGETGTQLN